MKTVITGQLSTKIKQPVEKLIEKERNPIMHILHTTPRTDGFCMPAEFDRHAGCLLIWPTRGDSWRSGGWPARKAFAAVAAAIARSEEVTMLVAPEQYETARAMLPPEVRLVEMETDDSWARDVCPTFVRNAEGTVRGIDWGFNAWGGAVDGLYPSWENDNRVSRKFCDLMGNDVYDKRDFICEGGSIHTDGEGTVLVTEACLLSAGRNPDLSKADEGANRTKAQRIPLRRKNYLAAVRHLQRRNQRARGQRLRLYRAGRGRSRVDGRRKRPAVRAVQGKP